MFVVTFKNGLPMKDFEFVDCVQGFEKDKVFMEQLIEKLPDGVKIFLLKEADIKKTSGKFKNLYIMEDRVWFEYEDKYLICEGVEAETARYFLEGNKKFILAAQNEKTGATYLLAEYTFK